jgi:alkylation response protein AidB-like acyl-CoA dehydrogenase
MDFTLSEEQQMLRDGAERYLAEHYDFDKRRAVLASATGWSESHWNMFAELGWLALPIPEDAGGLGGSLIDASLILEALGRRLVLEPYATNAILCAHLIDRSGNAGQRAELLPRVADGSLRLALAHTELEGRYDLQHVTTVARRRAGNYVLEGVKALALDAPSAHRLIVSARVEEGEVALFLIERDAPGATLREYPLIDGTHAADLELREVSVPEAALLVAPERARDVLDEAIDHLALARVAEALGCMEVVLDLTSEHLKNRVQFGQPLGKFQALQHRMAEMFVEVQEVRSILYRGLAYIDAPAAERRAAVSAARIVCAGAGRIVGGQGIQLHGGVGMTDEYPVGHYFKRLIALEKAFGDTDYHLERLAMSYR